MGITDALISGWFTYSIASLKEEAGSIFPRV